MTPREARYALAAAIREGFQGQVQESPIGAPAKPPAVVLSPRPTYLTQGTTCTWEMRLTVNVLLGVNTRAPSLDELEDQTMEIVDLILRADPPTVVNDVTDLGLRQDGGGIDYLTATINTTTYI